MPRLEPDIFHIAPDSWLGVRIRSGRQEIVLLKKALMYECRLQKYVEADEPLHRMIEAELRVINVLSDKGYSLRVDGVETARAEESQESRQPSVDIAVSMPACLLMVECKYRAFPETSIVKSIEAFTANIVRKFEASQRFFEQEGCTSFCPERIVLFNALSKEKVISMFRRLQLENEGRLLHHYKIMDTADFWRHFETKLQ